jgi:hypothetical protein
MGLFRHTADNIIFINSLSMPLAFFVTQEPAYTLPVGYITREYVQGSHNILSTGNNATGDVVPWTNGDTYISNEATYSANYTAYLASQALPQTLSDAKIYQIGLMEIYKDNLLDNGFIYSGTTFPTDATNAASWQDAENYFNKVGDFLPGYYIYDILLNHVSVTITDLLMIINFFYELTWQIRITENIHTEAINALGTIPAVLAYDYTTGWVTTPYVSLDWFFYTSYSSIINADYSLGSPIGTAVGGAAVAGGYLDLSYSDVRYVDYNALNNADAQQEGTIIFTLKPNYNGTPVNDQVFLAICKMNASALNLIQLTHANADGKIYLQINDSAGAPIINVGLDVWAPTAGTDYTFVLHYDIDFGDSYLFIDNYILGSVQTGLGTRDSNIGLLRVGNYYDTGSLVNSNFKIKKLNFYDI